jgi:general secretion pathway protein L
MKQQLFIRLADNTGGPVSWVSVDESGHPHHTVHEGSLEQAAELASDNREVIVLVPACDVLVTDVSIPGGKSRQLAQTLPYMIEDRLVGDVERQHIASRPSVNGKVHAAIASRTLMDGWTARVRDAGLRIHAMIPESFAVPRAPGTWSILLLEEGGALIRLSDMQAVYADHGHVAFMLQRLLDEHDEDRPEQIRLFRCSEAIEVPAFDLPDDIQLSIESPANPAVYLLAEGYARDSAINLLQGAYVQRHITPRSEMLWKTAAGLFLLWNLIIFAGLSWDNWRLGRMSEELQDSMVTMYKEVFPEARNVPLPRQQMQQHIERLQGKAGESLFLSLLASVAPVMRTEEGVVFEKIAFHNPQLDLELVMGGFAMLESLKQKLSGVNGVNINYQSSMKEDKQVHVHVRVTRAAP